MKLIDWRKGEGLSQKDLARKLGTTPASVCRYESLNRTSLRAATVKKICKVTKGMVTANDLYGISEEFIKECRTS